MKKLVFVGAGSHADALLPMVDMHQYRFLGYLDDKDIDYYNEFPVIGKMNELNTLLCTGKVDYFFIAIGDNRKRQEIYDSVDAEQRGKLINIVSNTATILSMDSLDGLGIFVGHNAFVGSKVIIGENSIVNTGAVVEHHSHIGPNCNIAPNATINGLVHIKKGTYIGSGAVVIQSIEITNDVMVGAGAVVIKNIDTPGTYVGVPAKILKTQ